MTTMLTERDRILLKQKGIEEQTILDQLDQFRTQFPPLELLSSASPERGIERISDEAKYQKLWNDYCTQHKTIVKFVPASGAASRMFKSLFEFVDANYNSPTSESEKAFFDNISKFAFYPDLEQVCKRNNNKSISELLTEGNYKIVVQNLLLENGLNYGNLPKGLLQFHSYGSLSRTPFEEHLSEGTLYAKSGDKTVKIHFTVSPEHRPLFEQLLANKQAEYEQCLDVKYKISFSEQKPKTDTIAIEMDNSPFREGDSLIFRPGGHGALIENLNDLDADIVFVKNIDNVILDEFKETEAKHKTILAGVLIETQAKLFGYLKLIESGSYSHAQMMEILHFIENDLNCTKPETESLKDEELVAYLKSKLNRPIRVCGMVKNEGEPGGGPFIAKNEDGSFSPQILESSQIDMSDPTKKAMFDKGTHFNPVDIVCGVKNYKDEKFDLLKYVDKKTGFISNKSKSGRELKALELPGLWNGAMSDWNTLFVEVPIETFNPVKTVNDLLRKEHQGK